MEATHAAPLTVILLAVAAGALTGCAGTQPRRSEPAARSVAVGERLPLDGMTYRVTRARSTRATSLGGTPVEARNGTIVAIRLEARNSARKARVLTMGSGAVPREWAAEAANDVDEIALIGGGGTAYATPSADTFFRATIQEKPRGNTPGFPRNYGATLVRHGTSASGWLLYDVPRRAARGARLIIRRVRVGRPELIGYVRLGLHGPKT